jgi:1,4-dihydroxy-6-naphthoate synthase
MRLSLGFSPCPNDTFIFDALVNNKIDTEGLQFHAVPEDVETLNEWALQGRLDITKLSFPAFFQSLEKYVLLNSGSALGKGVGPLLVSNGNIQFSKDNIQFSTVALPGVNTTANLLFRFAYPDAKNKIFMRFDKIENAVSTGLADLGVIIHENRFTYQQNGLHKIVDLGEYWENKMNVPIPLGGIAIKRNIDQLVQKKINELICKSLQYAFDNYPVVSDFVKQHSLAMSEEVMRRHIELYVNDYSLDLGDEGRQAISVLHQVFFSSGLSTGARHAERNLFLS